MQTLKTKQMQAPNKGYDNLRKLQGTMPTMVVDAMHDEALGATVCQSIGS